MVFRIVAVEIRLKNFVVQDLGQYLRTFGSIVF